MVYLSEFDSTLKKEWSPRAQQRLLREVAGFGNAIVFTNNQLVDSAVLQDIITSVAQSPNGKKTCSPLETILRMIDAGILCYSPYDDIHTPSQYVQNKLMDDGTEREFIFTCLPWLSPPRDGPDLYRDQRLLLRRTFLDALRYNDVRLLRRARDRYPDFDDQKIAAMEAYIRIIFRFSEHGVEKELADTPPRMSEFFHLIGSMNLEKRWQQAVVRLLERLSELDNESANVDSRSFWYHEIRSSEKRCIISASEAADMERIVDIAYNSRVRFSIKGTTFYDWGSKTYESGVIRSLSITEDFTAYKPLT